MCGIAGIINRDRLAFVIEEYVLKSMAKKLYHRGPDGYRIWISDNQQIGLMHRRLSIVDLSERAFQPFFSNDGTIILCCNGEIYNHRELRALLQQKGYQFYSNSDNEVIVHAYQEWGIACLDRLQGMFAFALVDLRKNELFLVRDRIGVKPLYFSLQAGLLSFASEIKALWCIPELSKKINTHALYHYLTFLVTPAPLTLYEEVYKLPAGYYLHHNEKKEITFVQWYSLLDAYSLEKQKELSHEATSIKYIRNLLRVSIQDRMMADVPYGVFLSGGIDSSLNVALMSECVDTVRTFTISFAENRDNEIKWARRIARHYNTEHHELIISEKEAFEFFESMVYHQDEPLGDCVCIPLYYVSKLLKDQGVTVVQVGEGSDELFCGYEDYTKLIDVYQNWWRPTQRFIPAFIREGIFDLFKRIYTTHYRYQDIVRNWAKNRALFWGGATAFFEKDKAHLIKKDIHYKKDSIVRQFFGDAYDALDSHSIVDYYDKSLTKKIPCADIIMRMMYLELCNRLPELLLMRVDKMTMATSVEARVPFLDYRVVECAFNIPSFLKYKDGESKYILKRAAEGILPLDIIYRKKMGFSAPTNQWFKNGTYFRPYFKDLLKKRRSQWGVYLDFDEISLLFEKNQKENYNYSLQLWILQNLIQEELE